MKKPMPMIVGIVVLVLVLGGAAFVGGRMLNGQGLPEASSGGSSGIRIGTGGGPATTLDIQPAAELPQTPAEARGIFDHRQDNSIFIGTGQVTMRMQQDQSGNVESSSSNDGPTVEAVVTTQTTLYRDVTLQQFDGPPPAGEKIQQVLEPGSLDEISQDVMVTVWGNKTGDRIIADVLVYVPPAVSLRR